MKDDRRRAVDSGTGHTQQPVQVIDPAQQEHTQDQYLHYHPVDSDPNIAQYHQQSVNVGPSYAQQAQYNGDEVEEGEESYQNDYDANQQQLRTASEAGGDSDEHESSKRKASSSNEGDMSGSGMNDAGRVDADGNPTGDGEPPKKRRRRQALSCTECKRRKIKCDRNHPCSPCARRGDGQKCQWVLLDPIVLPHDEADPSNPVARTTIHTTPYPPATGSEKYVLRAEFEELRSYVIRLEAILASIAPPGTFAHPVHPLQHQSPSSYMANQFNQPGMKPEGNGSMPQPVYMSIAGYPQVPIMLNVGGHPGATVNGAAVGGPPPSGSGSSPGIFASYLHNVPPNPGYPQGHAPSYPQGHQPVASSSGSGVSPSTSTSKHSRKHKNGNGISSSIDVGGSSKSREVGQIQNGSLQPSPDNGMDDVSGSNDMYRHDIPQSGSTMDAEGEAVDEEEEDPDADGDGDEEGSLGDKHDMLEHDSMNPHMEVLTT